MQRQYLGTNPLIWIVVLVTMYLVIGQYQEARSADLASKQSYVETACLAAQGTGDYSKCYTAQAETGIEFICDSSQKCWTEVK